MKLHALIEAEGDPDKLMSLLLPEMKDRKRSRIDLKPSDKGVTIEVDAEDAVAFRATMNLITQLLSIHERAGRIQ